MTMIMMMTDRVTTKGSDSNNREAHARYYRGDEGEGKGDADDTGE
jgi:hypothetical protein